MCSEPTDVSLEEKLNTMAILTNLVLIITANFFHIIGGTLMKSSKEVTKGEEDSAWSIISPPPTEN